MKMAIIGSGPLAIFTAQHFDAIGAEVTLFQRAPLGGNVRLLLDHFPQLEISIDSKTKTLEKFWSEDLAPAIVAIEENKLTKLGEVLRVHKRFLSESETIPNRTRLHDLFRVIFSVNPKEAILKQLEENPEMFKQLGESVIESLHKPVESFMDFDIVIDARGRGLEALPIGPSNAEALNENNIKGNAPFYYDREFLKNLSLDNQKNLIVVGHDDMAAIAMIKAESWLFERTERKLFWITPKKAKDAFSNSSLNKNVQRLFVKNDEQFDLDKDVFQKKMHEWRDLEDYMKAKIPMPQEPQNKIQIFEGHNVTAVDRLLDRQEVFATLESPDFRTDTPPNELRTLAADAIIICNGVTEKTSMARGMVKDEPGYYSLTGLSLHDGLNEIKKIEEKIMSFFSRA